MIEKIIFFVSVLIGFAYAQNQDILRVPRKLNQSIDGFEIINGDTILNVFMKVKPNSNTQLKSMGVTYSDTYGKSILSGSSVII
jgi:hypothetical protein